MLVPQSFVSHNKQAECQLRAKNISILHISHTLQTKTFQACWEQEVYIMFIMSPYVISWHFYVPVRFIPEVWDHIQG
jgi:hypothetical protein